MSTQASRQPAGTPIGGQFAASANADPVGVELRDDGRDEYGRRGVRTEDPRLSERAPSDFDSRVRSLLGVEDPTAEVTAVNEITDGGTDWTPVSWENITVSAAGRELEFDDLPTFLAHLEHHDKPGYREGKWEMLDRFRGRSTPDLRGVRATVHGVNRSETIRITDIDYGTIVGEDPLGRTVRRCQMHDAVRIAPATPAEGLAADLAAVQVDHFPALVSAAREAAKDDAAELARVERVAFRHGL